MDKETIIQYVEKTPTNTNSAVLKSMLDSLSIEGGNNWTLLKSTEIEVNTTSTSSTTITTISLPKADAWRDDKIIYIRIRDKEGMRPGYFYGCDAFVCNYNKNAADPSVTSFAKIGYKQNDNLTITVNTTGIGLSPFEYNLRKGAVSLLINSKYNATSSGTLNSTYSIDIYSIDFPNGSTI